jgi:hypothetical protein
LTVGYILFVSAWKEVGWVAARGVIAAVKNVGLLFWYGATIGYDPRKDVCANEPAPGPEPPVTLLLAIPGPRPAFLEAALVYIGPEPCQWAALLTWSG